MFRKINLTLKVLRRFCLYFWYSLHDHPRLRPGLFSFRGRTYRYFYHAHNHSWGNERAVEIPLVIAELLQAGSKQVLEIGNVLHSYIPIHHYVVDKYEVATGVKNVDVVDYTPKKKYDLIFSISTIEHVGWDENPQTAPQNRERNKIPKAIAHLSTLLKKKGKLLITVPLGYNADLDQLLKQKKLRMSSITYLQRINAENEWVEVPFSKIKKIKNDSPFQEANGLAVLILNKK